MQPARRHHSGAGAGARAGPCQRSRAKEAEGSPDGGQYLRARRQGSRFRGALSGKQRAMTARMDRRFAALREQGRAALVTFTMAGDPDYASALAILKALPKAG